MDVVPLPQKGEGWEGDEEAEDEANYIVPRSGINVDERADASSCVRHDAPKHVVHKSLHAIFLQFAGNRLYSAAVNSK